MFVESIFVGISTRNREKTIHRVDIADINFLLDWSRYTNKVSNVCRHFARQTMSSRSEHWKSLNKVHRHIYLEWPNTNATLSTRQEITTLHRGFSHPWNDKLLILLHMARPSKEDYDTISILSDNDQHCRNCQHTVRHQSDYEQQNVLLRTWCLATESRSIKCFWTGNQYYAL